MDVMEDILARSLVGDMDVFPALLLCMCVSICVCIIEQNVSEKCKQVYT